MSTVKEIEGLFVDLRADLLAQHTASQAKLKGDGLKDKRDEAAQLYRYFQMGLFVAESLIVDIKRVANALDGGNPELGQGITASLYEIAMNTQPKG